MTQHHIIKQQVIDLHVAASVHTFELQEHVSQLCQKQLTTFIANYCDQLCEVNETIRINKLECDLGIIKLDNKSGFDQVFIERFKQAFPKQLRKRIEEEKLKGNYKNTLAKTNLALLTHFIKTGALPWWSKQHNKINLEQCLTGLIKSQPAAVQAIILQQLTNIKSLQRFIYQFSDHCLLHILQLFIDAKHELCNFYIACEQLYVQSILCSNQPLSKRRFIIWQTLLTRFCQSQQKNKVIDYFDLMAQLLTNTALNLAITPKKLLQEWVTINNKLTQWLPKQTIEVNNNDQNNNLLREMLLDLLEQLLQAIQLLLIQPEKNTFIIEQTNYSRCIKKLLVVLSELQKVDSLQFHDCAQLIQKLSQYNKMSSQLLTQAATNLEKILQKFNQANNQLLNDAQEVYLDNAGLVILAPFLSRFFTKLKLVIDDQFVDEEATYRAIILLQYLVQANIEDVSEHELMLNKLLCQHELTTSLPTQLSIEPFEIEACDALLQATIIHWQALKNPSLTGFRHDFLQRKAKLSFTHDHGLLQVERKAQDVLLNKLPWNINSIRLPWMTQRLVVVW